MRSPLTTSSRSGRARTTPGSCHSQDFEELCLPDLASPVNNDEVRARGLHRGGEGIELRLPVVKGYTLDNDYCDNDLSIWSTSTLVRFCRRTRTKHASLARRPKYDTLPGLSSNRCGLLTEVSGCLSHSTIPLSSGEVAAVSQLPSSRRKKPVESASSGVSSDSAGWPVTTPCSAGPSRSSSTE